MVTWTHRATLHLPSVGLGHGKGEELQLGKLRRWNDRSAAGAVGQQNGDLLELCLLGIHHFFNTICSSACFPHICSTYFFINMNDHECTYCTSFVNLEFFIDAWCKPWFSTSTGITSPVINDLDSTSSHQLRILLHTSTYNNIYYLRVASILVLNDI